MKGREKEVADIMITLFDQEYATEQYGKSQRTDGAICEAIALYHEEMKLTPTEIIRKIMDRFGLEKTEAEKYVEETLNLQLVQDRCKHHALFYIVGDKFTLPPTDIHARLGHEKGKYILLSAHREENIDTEKNFTSLFTAINQMAEKYDMPILYSCHPRSRKRLESSGFQLDPRVIAHEPLGFHEYNCLQMNAFCVVSDSGTLPEESSFYTSIGHPIPAVCIRTSTERPEALDKGCFVLSGIDTTGLLQSVDLAVEMVQNGDLGIPVPDYVDINVSDKVVRIIQSYVGVVNKMVWRKS